MHGQWIGRIQGTTNGLALVDIDENESTYSGHALYFPEDEELSGAVVGFSFPKSDGPHELTDLNVRPIDRQGNLLSTPQMSALFPNAFTPSKTTLRITFTDGHLDIFYKSETLIENETIETNGTGLLNPHMANYSSKIEPIPEIINWQSFKSYISSKDLPGYIFRGQPCLNRLRTSFHRTTRSDLVRYLESDMPAMHRRLTGQTAHLFNLMDPPQHGAFLNLMQHHGYPTPLLDWTLSPYIAAFFAFRFPPPTGCEWVRIFVFNREKWAQSVPTFSKLAYLMPHFSIVELLGIENLRMVPQQAISSLSNIDDIESFISFIESREGVMLSAIDLKYSERETVLRDLSLMGITAASLFPGLDGTCEAMRNERFGFS